MRNVLRLVSQRVSRHTLRALNVSRVLTVLRAFAVIFPEDLRLTFYEQVSPRSLRLASNSSHCSNRRFGELDSVGQTSLYLVNQAFIYLTPSRKTSSSRDTAIFALHNRVFQIVYMHDGGRPNTPGICVHTPYYYC